MSFLPLDDVVKVKVNLGYNRKADSIFPVDEEEDEEDKEEEEDEEEDKEEEEEEEEEDEEEDEEEEEEEEEEDEEDEDEEEEEEDEEEEPDEEESDEEEEEEEEDEEDDIEIGEQESEGGYNGVQTLVTCESSSKVLGNSYKNITIPIPYKKYEIKTVRVNNKTNNDNIVVSLYDSFNHKEVYKSNNESNTYDIVNVPVEDKESDLDNSGNVYLKIDNKSNNDITVDYEIKILNLR